MAYISTRQVNDTQPRFEITPLNDRDISIAAILANTLDLAHIIDPTAIAALAVHCIRHYDGEDQETMDEHLAWFYYRNREIEEGIR